MLQGHNDGKARGRPP